jgi:hypothetical protein
MTGYVDQAVVNDLYQRINNIQSSINTADGLINDCNYYINLIVGEINRLNSENGSTGSFDSAKAGRIACALRSICAYQKAHAPPFTNPTTACERCGL